MTRSLFNSLEHARARSLAVLTLLLVAWIGALAVVAWWLSF